MASVTGKVTTERRIEDCLLACEVHPESPQSFEKCVKTCSKIFQTAVKAQENNAPTKAHSWTKYPIDLE